MPGAGTPGCLLADDAFGAAPTAQIHQINKANHAGKIFMNISAKLLAMTAFAASMLSFSGVTLAQEAPDALIKRISQEVIDIAKSDAEIRGGDRQRIMQLVETKILPHTDFRRAAALVTGKYWRTATPAQRRQLTEEFRKLLIYTYSGAMSEIRDQRIDVKPLRTRPESDDVVVHSEFRKSRGAEPVQVSYRLTKGADGWKIYDVNVMGIWMGLVYQNTFAAEIDSSGIDGLIGKLSEKNRRLVAGEEPKPSLQPEIS